MIKNISALISSPSKTVYYHSLVRWDRVDEIVFLTEPGEHPTTRELLLKALDHAVLEAALSELSEEEHEAFLELCHQKYHDEALLDWLEERSQDIRQKLTKTIQETKAEIKSLLEEEG